MRQADRRAESNPLVAPVLNGFRYVRRGNSGGTGQIRNGARNLEDAVISARRQSERADRFAGESIRIRFGNSVFPDFFDRQVGFRFSLPCNLAGARWRYTPAEGCARVAGLAQAEILLG